MSFDNSQAAHVAFRAIAKERTSSIVVWVGSGLSARAGLPTWTGLRTALEDAWDRKISSLDPAEREGETRKLRTARADPDHWLALELIRKGLGQTTFRDTVRALFAEVPRVPVPAVYKQVWQLNPSGLLNLNLDRLASRAFSETRKGGPLIETSGFHLGSTVYALKSPRPFIANLHGTLDDVETWVLTRSQLNALLKTPGYQEFVRCCLTARTVLFLGISADDVATGGHLESLVRLVSDLGTHFWVTDRRDAVTDRWAESNQIRLIRYDASEGDHVGLDQFFHDLGAFVPSDEAAPPVVSGSATPEQAPLLPPGDLLRESAETIRERLNAKAVEILRPGGENAYQEFERFCAEYDEAVYRAWYVCLEPPRNVVLGYRLEEKVGRGAFGTVYRATTATGEVVALKLLNHDVRSVPDMLQSFRRGVRSMRLLKEAGVRGMVPYLDASEIPTFVVMQWVEGPNLREAVEARLIDDWRAAMTISLSLAHVLRSAHALPQRVLHRDLRPSNVMLEEFYAERDPDSVVVLDFDLSWHLGAQEKTAMIGADTTGYLAPEQLHRIPGVSTRHASVDTFGLGMTLFFVVSGRDPYPTEHNHADWRQTVMAAVGRLGRCEWVSLPARYGRLILRSTRHAQAERWDMGQVERELSRLHDALCDPESVWSAELLAEELVARSACGESYEWDDDRVCATMQLPSGLAVRVTGDESGAAIRAAIEWSSGGQHSRKRIIKWLPDAGRAVSEILKSKGWSVDPYSTWSDSLHFEASLDAARLRTGLDAAAASLDDIAARLRFE